MGPLISREIGLLRPFSMSPFAITLKQFRQKRGLKQKDLALQLGYEPSYLSALERGEKGPPKQDFIRRFVRGLELNEAERAELEKSLRLSRRQFSLPTKASEKEFELVHELEPHLGSLTPLQIDLIKLAIRIPETLSLSGVSAGHSSVEEMEVPKM